MNTYLQELVVDFERTLARSGFGVVTHSSVQASEKDATTLVFVGPDDSHLMFCAHAGRTGRCAPSRARR